MLAHCTLLFLVILLLSWSLDDAAIVSLLTYFWHWRWKILLLLLPFSWLHHHSNVSRKYYKYFLYDEYINNLLYGNIVFCYMPVLRCQVCVYHIKITFYVYIPAMMLSKYYLCYLDESRCINLYLVSGIISTFCTLPINNLLT